MSDYYREQGYHSRKRLLRRLRVVFWLILAGLLVGAGFVAWDLYRSQAADTGSKLSNPINSTIVAQSSVQTTPYFQFQAPNKWRAIANETREGHYVYRQYDGPLVEQSLVIDIDNQLPEVLPLVATTRVLPVTVTANGTLLVQGDVSEHCKKFVQPPTARNQQVVSFNKVSFACSPDGSRSVAVVGLMGSGTVMKLPRPSGTTAKYSITYENLTATPSFRDMKAIIQTFETR